MRLPPRRMREENTAPSGSASHGEKLASSVSNQPMPRQRRRGQRRRMPFARIALRHSDVCDMRCAASPPPAAHFRDAHRPRAPRTELTRYARHARRRSREAVRISFITPGIPQQVPASDDAAIPRFARDTASTLCSGRAASRKTCARQGALAQNIFLRTMQTAQASFRQPQTGDAAPLFVYYAFRDARQYMSALPGDAPGGAAPAPRSAPLPPARRACSTRLRRKLMFACRCPRKPRAARYAFSRFTRRRHVRFLPAQASRRVTDFAVCRVYARGAAAAVHDAAPLPAAHATTTEARDVVCAPE